MDVPWTPTALCRACCSARPTLFSKMTASYKANLVYDIMDTVCDIVFDFCSGFMWIRYLCPFDFAFWVLWLGASEEDHFGLGLRVTIIADRKAASPSTPPSWQTGFGKTSDCTPARLLQPPPFIEASRPHFAGLTAQAPGPDPFPTTCVQWLKEISRKEQAHHHLLAVHLNCSVFLGSNRVSVCFCSAHLGQRVAKGIFKPETKPSGVAAGPFSGRFLWGDEMHAWSLDRLTLCSVVSKILGFSDNHVDHQAKSKNIQGPLDWNL